MSISGTHMTAVQAAEYLSITRQQVVALCTSQKLWGAEKIGDLWLIPRQSVEVYKYLQRKKNKKKKEKEMDEITREDVLRQTEWFETAHWSQLIGDQVVIKYIALPRDPALGWTDDDYCASRRLDRIKTFCHAWSWYLRETIRYSGVREFTPPSGDGQSADRLGLVFLGVSAKDEAAMCLLNYLITIREDYCDPSVTPFVWEDREDAVNFFSGALSHLGWHETGYPRLRRDLLNRVEKIYEEVYIN